MGAKLSNCLYCGKELKQNSHKKTEQENSAIMIVILLIVVNENGNILFVIIVVKHLRKREIGKIFIVQKSVPQKVLQLEEHISLAKI